MSYQYSAYCDICKDGSEWFNTAAEAREWRADHFADEHADNPLKKTNCRIKRRTIEQ